MMEPANASEVEFYKTLQSKSHLVSVYESKDMQRGAFQLIPTRELYDKTKPALSVIEEDKKESEFTDILLLELLNWFKYSFFKWVDIPNCESCGGVPEKNGYVPPNESEIVWGANRVENYFCVKCQLNIRFPRYNHPKKLLETRRGRCGEWANCFTFLCRTLGMEARMVFDWNDHVWTEVYSDLKKRWLHCDPCENVCDKPLLYEIGWKKPISYVIAFSKDEIQDVTWRYTSNFSETMKRRNLCRENWLIDCTLNMTRNLQRNLPAEMKNVLAERRILELASFLTEPIADEALGGRTSGSLAWRIARGEMHIGTCPNGYTFKLNDIEIRERCFHVKYSCSLNKYFRVSNRFEDSEDWFSCAHSFKNIIRKVEGDWKKTYLARAEGTDEAVIGWKFDFSDSGLAIQTLKFHSDCTTFKSGEIKWSISSDQENIPKIYSIQDVATLETCDFKGATVLFISATLTKGSGREAWQHTQLFRQDLYSESCPFDVEIFLYKR